MSNEAEKTVPVWLTFDKANRLPWQVEATRVVETRIDCAGGGFISPGIGYNSGAMRVYQSGEPGKLWHRSEEDALRRAKVLFTTRLAAAHAEIATMLKLTLQADARLAELARAAAGDEGTP